MNISDIEEDIKKLLTSFPQVCPPHLKGIETKRFSISGEILTSDEFLEKWKKNDEDKEVKHTKLNKSYEMNNDALGDEISTTVQHKRGRPKKSLIDKRKRKIKITSSQGEKDIMDFTEDLDQLLQEHIQNDIIIRKAFPDEIDDDEINTSEGEEIDEKEDIIVSNIDDDDDVQKKYLQSISHYEFENAIVVESDDEITSEIKTTSNNLKQQIQREGYYIHEVKGDGV